MKKYLRKFKAMVMVAAMMVTMVLSSVPAMAEDGESSVPVVLSDDLTTTIRVTGIEEGCNVYAYAIVLDAVGASGNHYWKYNSVGSVENRIKDGDISTDDIIYFYTHLNTGAGSDAHDGNGEAVVDATVLTMTYNQDGSYSVDDVAPGLYVLTANKDDAVFSYSATIVPVNYQYSSTGVGSIADENGVINVVVKKSDVPTIKKEVVDGDVTSKHGDANIGDVLDFKISLTIPTYGSEWKTENLHYVINDTLSQGLTLIQDSIKVEGTDIQTKFVTNKHEDATNITTNAYGFKLDLYGEDVYQYSGYAITITYQAVVNENATVNFDEEENKATLQYSTASNSEDLSDVVTDSTYHYTFGIDTTVDGTGSTVTSEITKFGVRTTTESNKQVVLDGAQFQLYNSAGKLLYFTSEGEYTTDTSQLNYITTKNGGKLTITGLDAGTYKLKESKAPTGYVLDTTEYTITISPTYNELTGELLNYSVTVNGGVNTITFNHEKLDNGTINSTDNAANADTFSIVNTAMHTLPETGGVGIIIITAVAAVMMAVFGSSFIALKREKHAN